MTEQPIELCAGIYRIRCIDNGMVYLGSASNVHHRIGTHIRLLCAAIHHNAAMQADWNRYGQTCFDFHLLHDEPDEKTRLQTERDMIQELDPIRLYNVMWKRNLTPGVQVSFRLQLKTLYALKAEADRQGRPVGNLISHLLDEHVATKGK